MDCLCVATCGPLEATLRLLQGFPEAEDREAQVPRIVQQLYNTDVCAHEHPQVQLALYELSLRWTRGSDVSRLDKLAMAACSAVLQQAAKRETKYNQSLRTKLTQILLKYCDVMEEYRSQLLPLAQPVIGTHTHSSWSACSPFFPLITFSLPIPAIEHCLGDS